jgi:hypothetical protein
LVFLKVTNCGWWRLPGIPIFIPDGNNWLYVGFCGYVGKC